MIPEIEIAQRLVIAAVLAALVGLERERNNQPAGLRTHIILVLGATLAMTLSINLAMQFRALAPNGDPARLAAQVISGIGFLGAGAILRYGSNIKGLTTATSLWTMAVVGLVVGAGYFMAAGIATALLLVTLIIINYFEKRYIKSVVVSHLTLTTVDRRGMRKALEDVLTPRATLMTNMSMQKDLRRKRARFEMTLKLKPGTAVEEVLSELATIEGVRTIKIS
jgi:putative Mg2+ transporter-C (MgtC) family protein